MNRININWEAVVVFVLFMSMNFLPGWLQFPIILINILSFIILSSIETNELWKIDTYLNRVSISSRFRNGEVTAVFEVSIFEQEELDKSELRNLLLGELV
jgi:hypothetical protein